MPRWLISLLFLCLPTMLHAEWREAKTEHFTMFSDGSEAELRETAAALEHYDRMLRGVMNVGRSSPTPIKIYLMANRDAVVRTTDGSDPHLAGYYTEGVTGPILVATRTDTGNGRFDIAARDVLFHEYAHYVMLQNADGAQPVWYAEGVAEYYATARLIGPTQFELGQAPGNRLAVLREAQDWIPVGQILAATDYGEFGGKLHLLYAQGWLLTHYLTQNPGRRDQLQAYFEMVSNGMSRNAAVDAAFGKDTSAFDAELRDYAGKNGYASRMVQLASAPQAAISVRALRAAEVDLLSFEIALGRGIQQADAASFLNELHAASRPHARDPHTRRILALAEQRIDPRRAILVALTAGTGAGGSGDGGR